MRIKIMSTVHHITQFLSGIVDARIPMHVWLDFATLDLYKRR